MHKEETGQVISIAKGGVGNQLFIFGAGKALAENLGYKHFIDNETGFISDSYKRSFLLDNFGVSSEILPKQLKSFSNLRSPKHKLLRSWNKILPLNLRSYIAESHDVCPTQLANLESKRKKIYLNGNWCNEQFFLKHRELIYGELSIPKPKDTKNEEILAKIQNSENSVFIHVRRVRYKSKLDLNYYIDAVQKLLSLVDNCKFFLFADDLSWAKENFKNLVEFVPIEHNANNELADLWLMSNCRHAILANSSFSWWGAWLGRKNDKKRVVIGPDNEKWPMKTAMNWRKLHFEF